MATMGPVDTPNKEEYEQGLLTSIGLSDLASICFKNWPTWFSGSITALYKESYCLKLCSKSHLLSLLSLLSCGMLTIFFLLVKPFWNLIRVLLFA